MKHRVFIICFAIVLLFMIAGSGRAAAQDLDDVQQGIKAYGTYQGGDFDSVSMTNGHPSFRIPLVSYPQRGKLHLSYSLMFNHPNISASTKCNPISGDCITSYSYSSSFFAQSASPVEVLPDQGFQFSVTPVACPLPGKPCQYSMHTPDGSGHTMAPLSSTDYESVDATGIHKFSGGAIDAEGTRYTPGQSIPNLGILSAQEDTNGNQITAPATGGFVDSVGRAIPPLPSADGSGGSGNCPTGPLPVNLITPWVIPGPNGGTSTFIFCWAKVKNLVSYDDAQDFFYYAYPNYLQSVVLPNGTSWTFQYSDDGWGSLTKITLPTGGTISYTWRPGGQNSRQLTSRILNANDGTGDHTWTYSYVLNTITVGDPLGNSTVYTNTSFGGNSYTTSVQYYQGAVAPANLVKTVSTTYSSAVSPFAPTYVMNVVPTQITTTWAANGKTSRVAKTYDSGFTFQQGTTYTGIYGKVITQKEYDYGTTSGQPGPLLKQTDTNYAWQSPNPNYSTYLSNNMLNLVYSTKISDGTNQKAFTQYGHDETATITSGMGVAQNLDTSVWTGSLRGNQTSVNRWLNLPAVQTVSNKTTYYNTGMPSVATDPLLHPTIYSYSNISHGAYLAQIQNAKAQSTYFDYDLNTGLLTSTTDPNGQITTESYDPDWRLTNVTRPTGGGETSFCYTDLNASNCAQGSAPFQVVITKQITTSPTQISETAIAAVDGLGRLGHTQLKSDPEGIDYVDSTYDGAGNKASQTNPYRTVSDSTYGIATYTYDALHRVRQVTQPDGSILKTAYCANTTLVTDEVGRWRRSTVDGLGRLIEVDEPNSPTATVNSNGCPGTGEPIWVTIYGYDTLGNLKTVVQAGSRQRSFSYDSLSRLLSATNPESGTLTYTYDANGNVLTKTAPAPNQTGTATVQTTNIYDALNRLTSTSYSDGATPSEFYNYDVAPSWSPDLQNVVGRLTNTGNQYAGGTSAKATATTYSYDAMGHVIREWEQTPSLSPGGFFVSSSYDLAGNLISTVHPAGTISYAHDSANRLTAVTSSLNDAQHPATLYSVDPSVGYYPNGAVRKASFGNGLTETSAFNKRLQPCRVNLNSGGAYFSQCANATPSGNVLDFTMGYNAGSSDNGNVVSWSAVGNQTFSRSYAYDMLNRIQSMSDGASGQSCKGLSWTVDAWGNLTAQTQTAGTCYGFQTSVGTNNQLAGYQYDAAGNMTYDGFHHYSYDAANRLVQVDSGSTASYIYNENGQRVRKNSGSGFTEYFYGPNGNVQDEYNGSSYPVQYVYAGSELIAEYTNNTTEFVHTDHLGSTRLVTAMNQGIVDNLDYLPFGQQIAGGSATTHKFTGKERDSESGLDNFGARYFASTTGRFMTPDWALKPITVPYANFGDPQTLNLYTYVENSPLNRIDADGHCGEVRAGECTGSVSGSERDNDGSGDQKKRDAQPATAQNTPQSLRDQIPGQVRLGLATLVQDSNSPTADDKAGGNHEEYAVAGRNEYGDWAISKDKPGAYANPDTNPTVSPSYQPRDQAVANSIVEPLVAAHVHPSGQTATHNWVQEPSAKDRAGALPGQINIVFGARDHKVYFFNSAGNIGKPMKMKDFLP